MAELHELTATELREALLTGEVSSVEIVEHYLQRIEALNPTLGALVTVTADTALAAAKQADHERVIGQGTGVLHGMPLADKDLAARAGVVTGFGSRLASPEPATDSDEVVRRVDAAGAISLGKTATPEFGFTAYTRNHRATALGLPQTKNPYDLRLDPGGSSGGAAVAVTAHLLPFAPGSDGGGSIRIPASATGLVGLKPTRGLIPDGPEMPGRLAVPGPIARNTADTALLLSALVDPTGDLDALGYVTAAHHHPDRALRIGLLTDSPWRDRYPVDLDPAVVTTLDTATDLLTAAGHTVEPFGPLPDTGYTEAFTVLWQNLAAMLPADGHEDLLEPLSRWLFERGRTRTEADLNQALAWMAQFEANVIDSMSGYDAILAPTLGLLPRPLDWFDDANPEVNFAQQCQFAAFTSFANVAGLPAIGVPAAMATTELGSDVPVGVQFIGPAFSEATLLSMSTQLEALRGPLPEPPMLVADSLHR